MRLAQTSLLAVLFVTALGCTRTKTVDRDGLAEPPSFESPTGTTTLTGANIGSLSNGLAIERLVTARCARETACNNVGGEKRFTNYDLCTSELRSSVGKDLEPSECKRGMDEDALDKCMDAIRSESCNNPIETLQRLATCRTSALCLKDNETPKR